MHVLIETSSVDIYIRKNLLQNKQNEQKIQFVNFFVMYYTLK